MLVDRLAGSASRTLLDQSLISGAGWLFVYSLAASSLSSREYDRRDSCRMEKSKKSRSSIYTMYLKCAECVKLTASRISVDPRLQPAVEQH